MTDRDKDTSRPTTALWTSRTVRTSRTSGGIWLRYAPHPPKPNPDAIRTDR